MISFKTHFITESMLEDIQFQDDLEEDILMLHEIEFKLSKLKDNPYSINSRLFQNLFRRFYDTAYEIMESVGPQMENGFEQWKGFHQIEDAETWANMVFENLMESYGDEQQTIESIMNDGIRWGQIELSPEKIADYVDPEVAKEYASEDIYNDPENYEYQIYQWLQEEKDFEGAESEAAEFAQENDLLDDFYEYYIANYFDPSYYADIIQPTRESVVTTIATEMYTPYMNMFGAQLTSIIDDLDEAVKRLEEAQQLDASMGDMMIGQSDNNLGKAAENIYKAVAKMTTAISLALNVNHVNGNILEDYANISSSFMDDLDSYDTTQWEKEVNAILKRY